MVVPQQSFGNQTLSQSSAIPLLPMQDEWKNQCSEPFQIAPNNQGHSKFRLMEFLVKNDEQSKYRYNLFENF